jgi:probable F420-dependent oxidoreductase
MESTQRGFRFGVSALPRDGRSWLELARRVEGLGFSTLLTADHLGHPDPFTPLAAAAAVTTTLRLGTFVLNNDFHHPLLLARAAATIDIVSGGRFELGLGAGHMKPEYDALGLSYTRVPERVARLAESVRVLEATWAGAAVEAADWGLAAPADLAPRPLQPPRPPLLLGGHSDALLALAAQHADIVGFTGITHHATDTGASRPTGFALEAIRERVAFVRQAAGDRFASLELNALLQRVVSERPEDEIEQLGRAIPALTPELLGETPFACFGPPRAIIEKLLRLRDELGITYFVTFEANLDALAPAVAELSGR